VGKKIILKRKKRKLVGFNFKYNGKEINLDVKVCDNVFSQARGLTFKKKSLPLLFVFKKLNRMKIHSFFCKPFIAIWFNGEDVVDLKVVRKSRFSIRPKEKFDKLLEIPANDIHFKEFLDEENI
jgi:uncharacterized membrane protein (UPF0127 family)